MESQKKFEKELMAALGISTRAQMFNYRNGRTEMKVSQQQRVQEVFAKWGIDNPFDAGDDE